MGIVISVYSKNACKEFFLTGDENTVLSIHLEKRMFRIEEDVATSLENIAGEWHFSAMPNAKIYHRNELYDGRAINPKDIYSLRTRYGEILEIFVSERKSPLIVFNKYIIPDKPQFTVGSDSRNDICYKYYQGNSNVVSGLHASFSKIGNDGWQIQDLSSNGTYVNGAMLYGSRQLVFGDKVEIWGLHIVFLGEILAIESFNEVVVSPVFKRFKINEDVISSVEDIDVKNFDYKPPVQYYHRPPRNMDRMESGDYYIKVLPDNENSKEVRKAYSDYLNSEENKIATWYQKNVYILRARYPSSIDICGSDHSLPRLLWSRNKTHADFLYHRLGRGRMPFQVHVKLPKEQKFFTGDSLRDRAEDLTKRFAMLEDVPICVDLKVESLIGIVGGKGRIGCYEIVYDLVAQIATQNSYTDVKMAFLTRGQASGDDTWEFALWLPHVWSEDKRRRYVAFENDEVKDVCYDLTNVFRKISKNKEHSSEFPHYVIFVEDQNLLKDELLSKYIFDPENKENITTFLMAEEISDLPNSCNTVIENDASFQGLFRLREGRDFGTRIMFDRLSQATICDMSRRLSDVHIIGENQSGEIPTFVSFFDMEKVISLDELRIEQRWCHNNTFESLRAVIGKKAGGGDLYLDLHEKYHGPHGLIAGTTGSGKSELLQTFILSLAVNFSPEDVNFFLIDYKGGGMAKAFAKLPHLIGQISNLSGNLARRAMISIKSENRRRQRIFNENGVSHIDAYTRLYKRHEVNVPLPHLFIIIDEFAQLKAEEPDFMRELISVAQVGRSLGVHLILATQKPGGVVDDNIWSNSKFRICLRVQDQKDSLEVLHKSDAAFLANPGRAILQVGNDELYAEFQSGFCGEIYDPDEYLSSRITARLITNTGRAGLISDYTQSRRRQELRHNWIKRVLNGEDIETITNERLMQNFETLAEEIRSENMNLTDDEFADKILIESEKRGIRIPERREKTQLEATCEYLAKESERLNKTIDNKLWLPELGEKINLEELEDYNKYSSSENGVWKNYKEKSVLRAFAGLLDDPVHQEQTPLVLNFSQDGNTAVFGMAMSGKSTFLQTVIFSITQQYSPSDVNIYIVDFGGRHLSCFEDDAHVGGILFDSDMEKMPNLIHMMEYTLERRKRRYEGSGFNAFHEKGDPFILFVLDDIASFREKTEDKYLEQLILLAREGMGVGIFMLITGVGFGIRDIPVRMSDSLRKIVALQLPDKVSYLDALRIQKINSLPDEGIPGRGLVISDSNVLEFQTAYAVDTDEYGRNNGIKTLSKEQSDKYTGKRAATVPFIPKKPTYQLFEEAIKRHIAESGSDKESLCTNELAFGYNRTSAQIESIDLRDTYLYLISGRSRCGKTNLLKVLLKTSEYVNAKSYVIETDGSELRREAEQRNVPYYTDVFEVCNLLKELVPLFKERANIRKQLRFEGKSDDEIFECMQEKEKIFVFIDDIISFSLLAHSSEGERTNLAGAISNLFEKGSLLNIYFFATYNDEKRIQAAGLKVLTEFLEYRKGIHLGGMADGQNVLRFEGIPYRELVSASAPGLGFTASTNGQISQKVLIPLV
ncbi:FtsK/SpoIIIE domain-containing protein [Butyrivibrio sp. NC3005]|uniref:FtsK/SpoIIIE domain-containing protein n=1 Tax=Butyrivibrio sp. NC3005 TaxID=1280685 RepID=UPI00040B7569|nr:FtsK/SpoIIIE domain-containing protein [Butyrivibrio sp. NC3005]